MKVLEPHVVLKVELIGFNGCVMTGRHGNEWTTAQAKLWRRHLHHGACVKLELQRRGVPCSLLLAAKLKFLMTMLHVEVDTIVDAVANMQLGVRAPSQALYNDVLKQVVCVMTKMEGAIVNMENVSELATCKWGKMFSNCD